MTPVAILLRRSCSMFLIAPLLSACSHIAVEARQVSALRGLLFPSQSEVDLSPFTWRLHWAGAEESVVSVALNDHYVFTHKSGVQVSFDGWNITRVSGLVGTESVVLKLDQDKTLRIEQGPRRLYEGACSAWAREAPGFVQRCEGLAPRRITIDQAGNIRALSFMIHPAYPALLLER